MLERGLSLTQSGNVLLWFPRIASDLGLAYALAGRLQEGVPLVEQAARQAASMRLTVSQSLLMAALGEVRLLERHLEEASEISRQALALSVQYQERGNQARILKLLGDVALEQEPFNFKDAENYYNQARDLATRLGMRPLVAHTYLGLGRLYGRAADRVPAHENLAVAAKLFGELDMRFWDAQAMAALRPE